MTTSLPERPTKNTTEQQPHKPSEVVGSVFVSVSPGGLVVSTGAPRRDGKDAKSADVITVMDRASGGIIQLDQQEALALSARLIDASWLLDHDEVPIPVAKSAG